MNGHGLKGTFCVDFFLGGGHNIKIFYILCRMVQNCHLPMHYLEKGFRKLMFDYWRFFHGKSQSVLPEKYFYENMAKCTLKY